MKDIDGYVTKDNLYRVISRIKYKPDIVVDNTTCNIIIEAIYAMPKADLQPVDAKEILRHLDSMMICIGNAYDTSHSLLRSDMEFIEKQEKIIKELLSDKLETRNTNNNYFQFIKDIEQEPISEMRDIKEGWGNE